MAVPLDVEIRSRLAAVLAGDVTLRDFYRWFMPATWEVDRTGNLEAIRLTHSLAHLFSELSAGLLTRKEMLRELELAAIPHAPSASHQVA